jgi:membrane protein DedA with SNARE-associated domain
MDGARLPVLGLLGTAGAAALFGAAFTWYLFGNRFGKISLRRAPSGKGPDRPLTDRGQRTALSAAPALDW